MSIIDTLITDRTVADVQHAVSLKEKIKTYEATGIEIAEYLAGLKGEYKASDLNRVAQACAYLYEIITSMGYSVPSYTALKDDWEHTDIPTADQMTAYISTIAALKSVWNAEQTIPTTMNNLGYDDANNIERLLVEVENISQQIQSTYIQSGAWNAYSGTTFYTTG